MVYLMIFWNPDISEIRTQSGRECPDLGGSTVLAIGTRVPQMMVTHELGWKVQRMVCVGPVAQLVQMSRKLYD